MGAFLVTFEPVILVFHFIVAIFLIGTILLQAGKGSDIGAAFGAGGSSSTLFGARGAATLLSKITTGAAVIFLITSLSLATASKYQATGGAGGSVIEKELTEDEKGNEGVIPVKDSGVDSEEE